MAVADLTGATLSELTSLAGRTAVVTGGARGIGLGCARRLAEAGAGVVIVDLDGKELDRQAAALDGELFPLALDLREPTAPAAIVERALSETGRLDILVNNAGIYPTSPLTDTTDETWRSVLDLNVDAQFRLIREAAPALPAGGGAIVNVASTAGFRAGGGGQAHYVTSKHAVIGLTKSAAAELAPRSIRVVAVAPNLTLTPGIESILDPDAIEELGRRLPLGRAGLPDDVARVVLFLVSDLAAFVTGTTVVVDGGSLA